MALTLLQRKRSAIDLLSQFNWFSSLSKTGMNNVQLSSLADVAQWIEHRPLNQRVASSIPSQGTCLGCMPGPQ